MDDKIEYRLYSFVNRYITGINAGIQTQHATVEMINNCNNLFDNTSNEVEILHEWMNRHKTTIVLNGGDSQSMIKLHNTFKDFCTNNNNPFGAFFESGIGGMLTSFTFVISSVELNLIKQVDMYNKFNQVTDDVSTDNLLIDSDIVEQYTPLIPLIYARTHN